MVLSLLDQAFMNDLVTIVHSFGLSAYLTYRCHPWVVFGVILTG